MPHPIDDFALIGDLLNFDLPALAMPGSAASGEQEM